MSSAMLNRKIINFVVGEKEHSVHADAVTPETTLNTYLRENMHLTGTKRMCGEGGCGCCTVAVEEVVDGKSNFFSVNSCLVSIMSCHGWKIHTVEGIGNPLIGYHKLQKLLSDNYGTQCGFCSSGMIMNMYALQQSGKTTKKEIENSFGGNICRCTGYRPILYAFKQLATNNDKEIFDIEDVHICPKNTGKICSETCKKYKENFSLTLGESKWIRVHNLKDLLEVLRTADDDYMLVCGNTARGVFKTNTTHNLYIEVRSVSELIAYSINDTSISLGGNVNLTQLMNICDEHSSKNNFSFLQTIKDHLDLVATVQVRNIGSIAGNLMMKYQHNEFQSDIFLLMELFDAVITIVDVDNTETFVSPAAFLKLDMKKKVIKNIVLKPLDSTYKFATYKIMPRAQNAHAMLNAGFLIKIENNLVKNARIVYGAINPTFIHASATEKLLIGLNLFDNATLQKVFKSLDTEIVPDYILPDPSPEFRKNLAISLFYKFVLKTCPAAQVGDRYKSGGTWLDRPISTGTQEYNTIKNEWPLTQPIPKLESLAQTSGQAKYIMDTTALPNEQYVAFVTAKATAGSTIVSIDASEALKQAGVTAYFDKKDVPGVNTFTPTDKGLYFVSVQEELFCSGTVQYYNQPIGIIVATSSSLASSAAGLVKVTYNAPQVKSYLNVKDVIADNVTSRIAHQTTVLPKSKGTNVKTSISGEFFVDSQYHYHMELQCCKVVPTEDSIDIYPSTQWMDIIQIAASAVLGINSNKINVKVRRLGGGFGGKMYRNALISSAAALAAYKLQIPITMSLSFEQNMNIIGKRYPLYLKYQVDVDDKGVIQYLDASLYSDFGTGGNEPIDQLLISGFESSYDVSHWEFNTYTVKTDKHANCFTRAPGTIEGVGAIEAIMEHIASTLNLEPIDVKLANTDPNIPQISKYWSDLKTWANIDQRKQAVTKFNQENRWMKQGLAIVPLKWLLEIAANYSVLVSIFHGDGGVAISHGGIEMGQGINTKVAQVCAYKFGIELEKVSIKPSYSFVAPNSAFTGGSLTSEAVCYALIRACDTLLERMAPIRKEMNNPSWVELIKKCFDSNVQLSANGFYWGDAPGIQQYPIYGICSSTVQVDILTGKYEILQVDILEDLGESMSPLVDIGQIEGAFIMGTGYFMTEQIIFDKDGQLMTNRTWNYKPPGAKDIPINFRIKFAENSPNPVGVLKSKAVAEPPMCLSVAVPLAVRNALNSARQEANMSSLKWIPFNGPTTVENTFLYSLNNYTQYVLK